MIDVLGGRELVQLPPDFREPKGQWSADLERRVVSDNRISLAKARIAAVEAIRRSLDGPMPEEFYVIGRDFNICRLGDNGEITFYDKPDDAPSQLELLYGGGKTRCNLITANSTTVLVVSLGDKVPSSEELSQLADSSLPLPEWVITRTGYSFMGIQLGSRNLRLAIPLLAKPLDWSKNIVPGVMDLTIPYLREGIKVFYPNGQMPWDPPITSDFFRLLEAVRAGQRWEFYSLLRDREHVENEMVGISTFTIWGLLLELGII
jgi:hypothetical protein